jgi:hypothetical protein
VKTPTAATVILILNSVPGYVQGIMHGYVLGSLTVDRLKGDEISLTGTSFSAVSNNIMNVYDRKNFFYFDQKTGQRVNMLPFLPTIDIKAEI